MLCVVVRYCTQRLDPFTLKKLDLEVDGFIFGAFPAFPRFLLTATNSVMNCLLP